MILAGNVRKFGDAIDTDSILPGRYLSSQDSAFLGSKCMEPIDPDFPRRIARGDIIVAGKGFGCGSSREHAVWALYEFGIRSVIAPSFGDIFITNCYKNGLLPVALGDAEAAALRRALHDVPGSSIAINLQAQTVADGAGHLYRFEIPAVRRKCLLEGLDDIARTEQYLAQFEAYEAAYCERYRWTHAGGSAAQPESLNKGITG